MAVDAQAQKLILVQAVARRLCHDLSGPLGALGAALECLAEEPAAPALASEAATVLTARLRLLRGAWGGGVEALDETALAALCAGLPGAERLRLNTMALACPLDGPAARLCLCLLLIGAAALPKGGTILIGGDDAKIWLELEGPATAPHGGWPAALNHDTTAAWLEDPSPRALPAALCRLIAQGAGWRLCIAGTRATAEAA
jgi:histidine phosphotransferase ChpT